MEQVAVASLRVTTNAVQEQNYDPTKTLLVCAGPPTSQQQRNGGIPTEESNRDHSKDELVTGKWAVSIVITTNHEPFAIVE